jgi:hypothetical protein
MESHRLLLMTTYAASLRVGEVNLIETSLPTAHFHSATNSSITVPKCGG